MKKPDNSENSAEAFLTTGEAARHCQVSSAALKRWIRAGRLAGFKTVGGHARIPVDEFKRFLREHGMPPYPAAAPASIPVLVVDDEPDVVGFLTALLVEHPLGFKVETATDGYEALIKVGAFKPALLILDVLMPLLDGVEVCRRLKRNPATRELKILGISGFPDAVAALLAAGADACLTKPLSLQAIERELERLLAPVARRW